MAEQFCCFAIRVEPWNVVFRAFHPVLWMKCFYFCNLFKGEIYMIKVTLKGDVIKEYEAGT
ncbi:MAG: hypothetical protein IKU41_03130, partial [Clostridia bacterium]|nr:hypothetical protein [Clostridia bacterium]